MYNEKKNSSSVDINYDYLNSLLYRYAIKCKISGTCASTCLLKGKKMLLKIFHNLLNV